METNKKKIVIIGAGSAVFTPRILGDFTQAKELFGSTIVLVDINEKKLKLVDRFAKVLVEEAGANYQIESTLNRRNALKESSFVVVSISKKRNPLWQIDFELANKYGIFQVQGENGGPGGLSLTLRNVPMIIDICKDMEEVCPDAFLLNFTNPESRICMAIDKYTKIKAVGLCHGVADTVRELEEVMKLEEGSLDAKVAGLNHFSWIIDLKYRDSGGNAYPLLRRRLKDYNSESHSLSRELFELFGLYPCSGDTHVAEYLSLYPKNIWSEYHLKQLNPMGRNPHYQKIWEEIKQIANREIPANKYMRKSGEEAVNIISAMIYNKNEYQPSVNIPNQGCILNLPEKAIVEIPGVVDSEGIRGISMGKLPQTIASLCQRQVTISELAVQAAVTGSRQAALEALLIDPYINAVVNAKALLDDILKIHEEYLPQFQ